MPLRQIAANHSEIVGNGNVWTSCTKDSPGYKMSHSKMEKEEVK